MKSFAKLKIFSSGCQAIYVYFFPEIFQEYMQRKKFTSVPAGRNVLSCVLSRSQSRNYRCCVQGPFTKFFYNASLGLITMYLIHFLLFRLLFKERNPTLEETFFQLIFLSNSKVEMFGQICHWQCFMLFCKRIQTLLLPKQKKTQD